MKLLKNYLTLYNIKMSYETRVGRGRDNGKVILLTRYNIYYYTVKNFLRRIFRF